MAKPTGPSYFLERLRTLAPFVGIAADELEDLASRGVGPLTSAVAVNLKRSSSSELNWLALAVLGAFFPEPPSVVALTRELRVSREGHEHRALLSALSRQRHGLSSGISKVSVLTEAVVVDVDFCARHTHNTGIQRVVRQTVSRWAAEQKQMELVAWMPHARAYRRIAAHERPRVLEWGSAASRASTPRDFHPDRSEVVIPFRSTVVVAEVPQHAACAPLAALAQFSGNRCHLVAYDMIPVVSASSVPAAETSRFLAYLTFVKHAHKAVAISESTATEFRGFVSALASQGLVGPEVTCVPLPVAPPDGVAAVASPPPGRPLVLTVGSIEPRKNQHAVLAAAERLWLKGLDFRLEFIGGGSSEHVHGLERAIQSARKRGCDVELRRGVTDAEMAAAYQSATLSVFPSLHEGYGLPVAESLAYGVPVVTSNFGATAEVAQNGGCLLVDPRDEDAIAGAMLALLTKEGMREDLRRSVAAVAQRSWDDYAVEAWTALCAGREVETRA